MKKHELLENLPDIVGKVLEIYARFREFDRKKFELKKLDKELPIMGPFKDEEGTIYYG